MSSGIYNVCKSDMMSKAINFSSDTFKVGLLNSGFAVNAANTTWANVSANEITPATNYTAGGKALTGLSLTGTTTTVWTAANVSWTSASFTANYAVIYNTSNSNRLIAYIDFGGAQTVTVGTFTIQWSGSGIISIT